MLVAVQCVASAQAMWRDATLSCEHFRQDFNELLRLVEAHHGGLYAYTDSATFHQKAKTLSSCNDESISLAEVFYRMAQLVDEVHDGHTWLMPSRSQATYLLGTQQFIPLTISVMGTEMYVETNFSDCHALVPGSALTSIDQMPVRSIVRDLLPYFTADGFSLTGKLGLLESQFWWYYGLHYGFRHIHQVAWVDHRGELRTALLKSMRMNDRIRDINEIYTRTARNEAPVAWHIEHQTGILRVSTFTGFRLARFRREFSRALEAFNSKGIHRLVIDVRGNGGGREGVENLLLGAMAVECSEKYERVTIRNPLPADYTGIEQRGLRRLEDLVYRMVEFRRSSTNEWERRQRYRRTLKPFEKAFTGPVAILVDRNTFSGAAEFAALVRNQVPGVIIIGEETCGGYKGHTSGYAYEANLPYSGFKLHIPRVRFDLIVADEGAGGVVPNISIEPSVGGHDRVLDFALTGGWWNHAAPSNAERVTQSSR